MVYASFNLVIAVTVMLSGFFIHRFNKLRAIYACSIALSITTPLLFISNVVLRSIIIFVEGVFFSMIQLLSFTYFWNLTVSEERGRIAGLAGFFYLPLFQIPGLMAQSFDFSGALMVSIILGLAPLTAKLLKPQKNASLTPKKDEKSYNPEKRTILLYSVPWILFSLINVTLSRNISLNISQSISSSLYVFLLLSQGIGASIGALGGGIIADFFGRRLSLSLGLTLFGISSTLVGFIQNYELLCFVYVVNGLNWGILWVLYGSVVWGDLANEESYTKRYSLGLTIYYLTTSVGFFLTQQISQIPLITSAIASAVLIFLSNMPLILAPELLSSDFRERIKLRFHMSAVRKIGRKSQNHG